MLQMEAQNRKSASGAAPRPQHMKIQGIEQNFRFHSRKPFTFSRHNVTLYGKPAVGTSLRAGATQSDKGGDGMKVAVIGSRSVFPDAYEKILAQLPAGCSEIVSGGAVGIDLLARKAAKALNLRCTCIRPNYRRYGRTAPLIRNSEIIDLSDCVLAFWDGISKGTQQALVCCIKRRKPFKLILVQGAHKVQNIYSKDEP